MRALVFLLLVGCHSVPWPRSGARCEEALRYADADDDGFGDPSTTDTVCPGAFWSDRDDDCDDAAADAYPGAPELCNGRDDDCDGEVDENLPTTVFHDADGDGYGAYYTPVSCGAPSRDTVANALDCDDRRDHIGPHAAEVCNGYDDDCDGEVDEGAPDAWTWYVDADGDGFGAVGSPSVVACERPWGHAAAPGDCDDDDARVKPNALEWCNGRDDDCDGLLDRADPDELGDATWFRDDDGDGFAVDGAAVVSCTPPAGYADTLGDCDDAAADAYPGAIEVCGDGRDTDCDGLAACDLADADATITPVDSGTDLWHGAGLGDVDGDGRVEIALGAVGAGGHAVGASVVIFSGDPGPFATFEDAPLRIRNEWDGHDVAEALAPGGDLDGDGVGDLVVFGTRGQSQERTVFVFSGDASGDLDTRDTLAAIEGSSRRGGHLLAPVGAGDLDGDGVGDLLLTERASTEDFGHVIYGPLTGDRELAHLIDAEVRDVWAMAGADVDGDGRADLVATGSGGVYAFTDPIHGDWSIPAADRRARTDLELLLEGPAVDVDGDGYEDLVARVAWSGWGYVVIPGPLPADGSLEDAGPLELQPGYGSSIRGVAPLGDVDGDGIVDLLVAGEGRDAPAAWLVRASEGPVIVLDDANARYRGTGDGFTPVAPGDVDGDGLDDLILIDRRHEAMLIFGPG